MPKREIKIDAIRWDATDLQARVRTDPATVAAYAERMEDGDADSFPAIIVFYDGTDYWPADGWHTGAAATKAGFATWGCDVRDGTREDAFDYALSANANHGLQRSNADKRKAVEMALRCERHSGKSDSAVAELCRVNNKTVFTVREQLGISQPETRTGKDGKQYPAKRTKPDTADSGNDWESAQIPTNQTEPDTRASVIRDMVPVKENTPKRPAPFVDRFDSLFGPLVRFMDEAAEHYGAKDGGKHRSAMNALNLVAECHREMRDAA